MIVEAVMMHRGASGDTSPIHKEEYSVPSWQEPQHLAPGYAAIISDALAAIEKESKLTTDPARLEEEVEQLQKPDCRRRMTSTTSGEECDSPPGSRTLTCRSAGTST